MAQTINEVMTHDPITVDASTTIAQVARKMREGDTGAKPPGSEATGERERLTVTQLNASLGAASAQCGNDETVEFHTVRKIDR